MESTAVGIDVHDSEISVSSVSDGILGNGYGITLPFDSPMVSDSNDSSEKEKGISKDNPSETQRCAAFNDSMISKRESIAFCASTTSLKPS